MDITTAMLLKWLRRAAALVHEQRDYLTELDAAIGDADHGINLDRGFNAIVEMLPLLTDKDVGVILKSVGMRLISTVGGDSGPLYGTAFRRAGIALEGRSVITPPELITGLQAFIGGVMMLGKAERGQKTMLDALIPALERLDSALTEGSDLPAALVLVAEAAHAGAAATIPMIARRGRASYLGERSIGHQDPGATSSALLLQSLAESV